MGEHSCREMCAILITAMKLGVLLFTAFSCK